MKKFSRGISLTLFLIMILATAVNATTLIPGGQVIGLTLEDETVTVADFDPDLGTAAKGAGLRKGDRILKIDGIRITAVEDVRRALSESDGQIRLQIQREGKNRQLTMTPTATAEGARLGVYLRQGMSGLGTVTYYDPATGSIGALGHGVNTPDGSLLALQEGSIFPAQINSVKKGTCGTPGQLLGSVTDTTPTGQLSKNTDQGIFGTSDAPICAEALPVAKPEEITTGSATIRSTVAGTSLREYSVEILKIYPNTHGRTRNMLLKVTDPALLSATGGIVQGMSGSPIIQDGKLIGAVTHVLVNDPTTGYGIFIENMLDAAA